MLEEMIEFAVEVAADVAEAVITDKVKKSKERKKNMSIKSLIINPGSTSTKIGVFEDEKLWF